MEWDLSIWAEITGTHRADESSFDSDHFPKVILADSDDDLTCGACQAPLID